MAFTYSTANKRHRLGIVCLLSGFNSSFGYCIRALQTDLPALPVSIPEMMFRLSIFIALSCFLSVPISALAQTFTVSDSTATVTIPAGLSAGDSIRFQGNINVPGADAVDLDLTALPTGISLSFQAGSRTVSSSNDGVTIDGLFSGNFTNLGTISGVDEGIDFNDDFSGVFINRGSISGDDSGVNVNGELSGRFLNTGTIAGDEGVDIDDDMSASFVNTGNIVAVRQGVDINEDLTGSFLNSGLIRSTEGAAIEIEGDLTGSLINTGTIFGGGDEGIDIFYDLSGSLLNQGTIVGGTTDGVYIDSVSTSGVFTNEGMIRGELDGVYVEFDYEGSFTNSGTITGIEEDGVDIGGLSGTFMNTGTITGVGNDGVYIDRRLSGTLTNTGTIRGMGFHGLHVGGSITGDVTNTGIIAGADFGLLVDANIAGSIFNCGIIEAANLAGIRSFRTTGVITNDGGRIQGGTLSIRLGRGDGTVLLSGPSHLVGAIGGGGGSDTVRFENMRGISAAKKAELSALAATDPLEGSITLFGEAIAWQSIEDIQADLSTLQSYESLITGPGLQQYGAALDNVLGLNDDFRNFLKDLNKVDASLLNEIASNASGQTLINGVSDFARNQDSRVYSLLMNEFSTLRGDISGATGTSNGEPSGLFAREIPVGATATPLDETTKTYIAGYVGRGTQNRSLMREESAYDNATILFGVIREVSAEWQLGLFGGYTDNESAVDRFGSLLKNEAAYFGVNALYTSDYLFANLVAAYGFHDQASLRRDFFGNIMDGDTSGHQGLLYTQIGRDFYLGEESRTKVSPYVGFSVSSLSMGDFTENGPATTSLRFADESTTSVQTVLGVNASFIKETNYGWLKPRIDAGWWHEYTESGRYGVSLASPGLLNSFNVFSPSTNRNRGIIQIGTNFGFDCWENVSFDISYFGTTGEDGFSAHGGALSATFEF